MMVMLGGLCIVGDISDGLLSFLLSCFMMSLVGGCLLLLISDELCCMGCILVGNVVVLDVRFASLCNFF